VRVRRTTLLTGLTIVLVFAAPAPAQTAATEPASPVATETSAAAAQSHAARPHDTARRQPVENADIIAMVQNHLSDDAILGMIELNETRFDVSADGLIALKKAGVSDRVLNAMLEGARRPENPPATPNSTATAQSSIMPRSSTSSEVQATPQAGVVAEAGSQPPVSQPRAVMASPAGAPPGLDPQTAAAMQIALNRLQSMGINAGSLPMPMGMGNLAGGPTPGTLFPRVFLLAAGKKTELSASMAQRAVSKFAGGGTSAGAAALSSLASEALSFATIAAGPSAMVANAGFSIVRGFMPGSRPSTPKITYAWGLPGAHSGRALPAPEPAFELVYKDIPGIDPDAFEPALVRLILTRDNYRLVGATRQEMRMQMGAASEPPEWVSEDRVPARLQKSERGAYTLLVETSLPPGEYAVVLRPVKHYKAQPSGFGSADQLNSTVWDFSLPAVRVAASPDKAH
jgi:hypothetical protein